MSATITTSEQQKIVEIQAYADGPPTPLDVAKPAPFGWWPAVIIALAAFIDRAEGAITLGAAASLQEEFGFDDAFLGRPGVGADHRLAVLRHSGRPLGRHAQPQEHARRSSSSCGACAPSVPVLPSRWRCSRRSASCWVPRRR